MSIPGFQAFMLPILNAVSNGEVISFSDLAEILCRQFKISDKEKEQLLPSGIYPIYRNRIGWAKTYLAKAKLIENPSKGYVRISQRGIELLKENPETINIKTLTRYNEFVDFRYKKDKTIDIGEDDKSINCSEPEKTPEELLVSGYELIQEDLKDELLEKVLQKSPDFFEYLVGALLEKIGYVKPTITGKSGDHGIDGFINQDALGLEKVYFQAKRFKDTINITPSMLRDFVGTLDIEKASKGVFITTSKFPKDIDQIKSKGTKSIAFIDGDRLIDLMIKYNVGTYTDRIFEIKKIDLDFFEID